MDAADPGWRRLGAVLVEAGLVSEHDLVEALAEQERSGERLGEVLVARGLVSAAAVSNALAEQHGSFLKTEHGFGTGLRALIGQGSVPESGAAQPEVPPLSPTQPPELALGDTPAVAVDSSASAERPEAEPAVSEGPQRSVAWTAGPPPAAAPQASSSEQERERALEAQGQPHPDLGHLLFVPTYTGYLLLQRSGTAPALGEVLELPDTPGVRLIVAKLALSPLPQDRRVCAYLNNLQDVHTLAAGSARPQGPQLNAQWRAIDDGAGPVAARARGIQANHITIWVTYRAELLRYQREN